MTTVELGKLAVVAGREVAIETARQPHGAGPVLFPTTWRETV